MHKSIFFQRAILALSSMAILASSFASAWSQDKGNVVVFQANWCASCREVVPIAREVAGQNGVNVVVIDVDAPDAPKQARSYGVGIPNDEPPQVFYTNKGRTTLLFNGRGYKRGSGNAARTTILQNLQQAL